MKRRTALNPRAIGLVAASVVLVVAMALSTKVVKINSTSNIGSGAFSAPEYGASEFPKVQALVEKRAVNVTTLASAIVKDPVAAAKQYGITNEAGPEFSTKMSGTVGKGDSGNYDVSVPGVAKSVKIQIQTGPAIIGTDLRDATGSITFGQFTNQIDYQNAGTALNSEMKKEVLSKLDAAHLSGKKIAVVGAFSLTDPTLWLVTPVKLEIQ